MARPMSESRSVRRLPVSCAGASLLATLTTPFFVLILGCEDDGTGPGEPPPSEPPEAARIQVSPAGASISGVGTTFRFTAEGRSAQNQAVELDDVRWKSLDPTVATVDSLKGY